GGLRAVWIPCRETRDGYVYVHEEDVLRTVLEHPEAKTLLLTRPDYYGGCIPLRRIVETCHGMGIRVAVDEAHGAHFPWSHEMQSAGCFSVDAWVQSCHKTLPALTGSAVLHLRDSEDLGRAMRILRREETSSPSFLLVMSIDDARAYMEKTGGRAVEGTEQRIREGLRKWIRAGFCDPRTSWAQETGYTYDPARLVLRGRMPGQELQERLAENGVDVEMADTREVVMIPPLGAFDRDDFWKALDVAVMKAGKSQAMDAPPHSESHMVPLPECRLTMRAAEMADHEVVPLKKAAGRTSAVSAGLYPPGIPMVVPGEVISSEISELLNEAGAGRRVGVDREDGICVVV
ncbi:MAG: hypothetical protein IJ083_10625, partial [Clostridia bacterium]|nr:hypothetical protein [Clostridia bacterium]